MQPKHICLYLLAVLMFTSTGRALPVNHHQPRDVNPNDPKPALPQHLTRRVRAISPASYKSWFLNANGRLIPNVGNTPDKETTTYRKRVGQAFLAIYNANKEKPDVLANLHYVSWKGEECEPYCFGLTVREERPDPKERPNWLRPNWVYSELHYPNDNPGFGKLTSKGGKALQGEITHALEGEGEVATFLNFLEGFKEKVMKAKDEAKKSGKKVNWPVLEMMVPRSVPVPPPVGSHKQGALKSTKSGKGALSSVGTRKEVASKPKTPSNKIIKGTSRSKNIGLLKPIRIAPAGSGANVVPAARLGTEIQPALAQPLVDSHVTQGPDHTDSDSDSDNRLAAGLLSFLGPHRG
ncbi:hypothetical protein BDP27DRAFT_1425473 [Rhodocollybia butyracea]|uniref:Uncharacterized protein n=1 Tax=Rhodocollybia butyracea TaxID=206335 RepID=A0A9P5PK54_9AGAR|nr:hypothetical protein BDP27DRAFT_1425473 [Rhodocollybia butyracea]